jgi:ATP synthase protein I
MSQRHDVEDAWQDDDDEASGRPFKRLSREDAERLRAQVPTLSPWRVVAGQAVVGVAIAFVGWVATGRQEVAWSALYGALVVVVPGALMARGTTSRLTSLTPVVSAVSVMLWESIKIIVSVAMLVLAPKVVRPLSWPALLVALAAGLSVYWFALLWRGRKSKSNSG